MVTQVTDTVFTLFESYQLDRFASRCSRKNFNLLKDSLRERGCVFQYSTFVLISAFTFLW